MNGILTSDHRTMIDDIERESKLTEGSFKIVPSIYLWCRSVGLADDNVQRTAKTVESPFSPHPIILIKEEISPEEIESVFGYMRKAGYGDVADRITDEVHFLQVLCFHEVAHLKLKNPTEEDCDRWALEKAERSPTRRYRQPR